MATRAKRTYNLAATTIHRVRELSEEYGAARTQDAVVDLAVERLYFELREQAEAARWTAAADDPGFRAEVRAIAHVLADLESWPA
jgi:hypothetical protein